MKGNLVTEPETGARTRYGFSNNSRLLTPLSTDRGQGGLVLGLVVPGGGVKRIRG